MTDGDSLTLLCFQELWAFKVGLFPKTFFRALKHLECIPVLSYVLVTLSIILVTLQAFLLSLFINITRTYDPKETVSRCFRNELQHVVQSGFIPWTRLMDDGLLMLSNRAPSQSGFHRYRSGVYREDALTAKGFIWCRFDKQVCGTLLVLNTHLQSAGSDARRAAQLQEMRHFIRSHETDRVLVIGDFNMEMQKSDALDGVDIAQFLSLSKLSDERPSNSDGNVDHVLSDLNVEAKTCLLLEPCTDAETCTFLVTETCTCCPVSDHKAIWRDVDVQSTKGKETQSQGPDGL